MSLSSKDIQQLMITGVLAVVLVVVLAAQGQGHKKRKKVPPPAIAAKAVAPAVVPQAQGLFSRLGEVSQDMDLKRDPFVPYARSSVHKASGPFLSGILWDPQHPTAIINQQIVASGDEVDGYRVVTIAEDHVILNHNDEDLQISVNP